MSDSDDTDVLLIIPPDLFLVPSSSESDISSDHGKGKYGKNGVISELVEHMQSLENRITAIESKDVSVDTTLLNNSLESQVQTNDKFRQTLPRTTFSLSQGSSLQSTHVKPDQALSVPSIPNSYLLSHTNFGQNDGKLTGSSGGTNKTNVNDYNKQRHDHLISHSESSVAVSCASRDMGFPYVTSCKEDPPSVSYYKNIYSRSNQLHSMPSTSTLHSATEQTHSYSKTSVQEMELSEVDELLQEMEATELELSKRINRVSMQTYLKEQNGLPRYSISRKLDFNNQDSDKRNDVLSLASQKRSSNMFPDISLPHFCDTSCQLDETEKMISEFTTWEQSVQKPALKNIEVESTRKLKSIGNNDKPVLEGTDVKKKETVYDQVTLSIEDGINGVSAISNIQTQQKTLDPVSHNESTKYNTAITTKSSEHIKDNLPESIKILNSSEYTSLNSTETIKPLNSSEYTTLRTYDIPPVKCVAHASTNTDFLPRKSQRLLALSDFWDSSNKSQEEMRRIKLEEEKFRREHCEHLIQELQKRLLEQQEKVAVALRVDNEKNELIAYFHSAWSKLKQRVQMLENEYNSLQTNLKNVTEKHQLEVSEFQSQIKRYEGELSKALDLAAGYKEKSDAVIKEKVELLKAHADELENYKSFVQEAENRYDVLKSEYNILLEKNQQTEESLKNLQQELGKERLKGGEVRNEMNVIHKALDTCEAELIVLKQEKENLQLKVKEEISRNTILEQKNASLLSLVDDAKKAERLAKDETKSLAEQKEKIRSELQDVYQKQVDEVVKVKLQEFQTQLDAAETEFLEELKTRQQVIAECAARKMKDIMDKHRLEINLIEEKHKEEKRLCELQLAQALQKSVMLETQLNSQRATKSQLAEQLHSVMQKQWQQALQIISGGSMENLTPLQKLNAEKLFDFKGPMKSESMPNCYAQLSQEPVRLTSQNDSMSTVTPIEDTPLTSRKECKDELRRYIKMIAEMHQSKEDYARLRENNPSPPLACRSVPRKHYLKKELSIKSEDSITWQPASETTQDTTDFIPISQKVCAKGELQKCKPPWK